jgi:hypothetical protein
LCNCARVHLIFAYCLCFVHLSISLIIFFQSILLQCARTS